MSRNQAVISAFKSDAVWIQQLKDPSLPRYLFGLYKAYMKRNTGGAAKNDTGFSNLYCLSIEIFIHSFIQFSSNLWGADARHVQTLFLIIIKL